MTSRIMLIDCLGSVKNVMYPMRGRIDKKEKKGCRQDRVGAAPETSGFTVDKVSHIAPADSQVIPARSFAQVIRIDAMSRYFGVCSQIAVEHIHGLALEAEAINVGKLGRNILAVPLGGLEARLLYGSERFFIEAGAAAFNDFRLCHFPFGVDLNL